MRRDPIHDSVDARSLRHPGSMLLLDQLTIAHSEFDIERCSTSAGSHKNHKTAEFVHRWLQ